MDIIVTSLPLYFRQTSSNSLCFLNQNLYQVIRSDLQSSAENWLTGLYFIETLNQLLTTHCNIQAILQICRLCSDLMVRDRGQHDGQTHTHAHS